MQHVTDALLRRPVVEDLVGLKKSSIYQMMKQGTFPRPVPLGKRAVAWRASEIQSWIDARGEGEQRPALQAS